MVGLASCPRSICCPIASKIRPWALFPKCSGFKKSDTCSNARLLIKSNGNICFFSKSKKVTKIKKKKFKKIKFFDEDSIEKKLKNLWKKNILLDRLSCSIYFKNLLYKRKPEKGNRKNRAHFFAQFTLN